MFVKMVANGNGISLMNLNGSRELCRDHNGKVIKWFDREKAETYAKEMFMVLCKPVTSYCGLLIHKASDGLWYVTTPEGDMVMTYATFKKEATAKELIDWHCEAIA